MIRLKKEDIIRIVIVFCLMSQGIASIIGQWWMFILDILVICGIAASVYKIKFKYCEEEGFNWYLFYWRKRLPQVFV